MMLQFTAIPPVSPYIDDLVGFIPMWLDVRDRRPAREQLGSQYIGGWHPFEGFRMDPETRALRFTGDPPMRPLAEGRLREETVLVYQHGWVVILQPDGSFEACRMD